MTDYAHPALRTLFDRIDALASPDPDLAAISDALVDFVGEAPEFLDEAIAAHGSRSGTTRLHAPERGPRLTLAHRNEGEMSAVHSHRVWVAITPVMGVETHRLYAVERLADGRSRLQVAEERHIAPGQAVFFAPPNDVHAHGHVSGTGEPAYVLILAGDNQRAFEREQFDPKTGDITLLRPGEAGDWLQS